MSLGLSKRSRKGGSSGFGCAATRSGLAAAMEASFDRNGSLGFTGGKGGDADALARRLPQLLAALFEEVEDEAIETGIWGDRDRRPRLMHAIFLWDFFFFFWGIFCRELEI